MPDSPLVSVVIPTLNEARYLPACLDSLKKQTYPNFEVICVDASTDSTPDLVRSAGWQVQKQVKPGIGAARAEGWAKAAGEIIMSTDADTILPPDWIETAVKHLADPKVAAVHGPVWLAGKNPLHYRILIAVANGLSCLLSLAGHDHLVGMNFAARKSAYLAAGGFDANRKTAEDADLGYRLAKAGKILYVPRLSARTSNRRLKAYTIPGFLSHHLKNYFSFLLFKKSSSRFEPIR